MPDAIPVGRTRSAAVALLLLAPLFALLGACAAPNAADGGATASAAPVATSQWLPVALANPGFESAKRDASGSPEGWDAHQHIGPTAYTFTLDRTTKRSGEASMRIRNLRPEVYGSITRTLPASAYRGKTLRFSVWLRTQDVVANDYGKGATPLLQAFIGGSPAVSASYEVAAVAGTTEWVRRDVVIDVPAAAEWIEVGVMLTGSGTVWLDDTVLETTASR